MQVLQVVYAPQVPHHNRLRTTPHMPTIGKQFNTQKDHLSRNNWHSGTDDLECQYSRWSADTNNAILHLSCVQELLDLA